MVQYLLMFQDSHNLTQCLRNPQTMVLLWLGDTWPTDADNELVKQWVENGGALIHGFNPHENLQ